MTLPQNKQFHIVLKKTDASPPQKMLVSAVDVKKAMDLMVVASSVKSTTDLHEFEIMEVVGKDMYKLAAKKLPTKTKAHVQLPVVINKTELDRSAFFEELPYKSYKVRLA